MLDHLKANNRAWAARKIAADAGLLQAARAPAGAGVSVDRLLRQPGAGQRDRRPRSRRAVRPPQRRQPRPAAGRQLPLRAAVRRRRDQGEAHHGGRPLRLRRRRRGGGRQAARPGRPLAAPDPRGLPRAPPRARGDPRACRRASTGCASSTSSARCATSRSDVFVQDAWARGQALAVHGWVYSLANGLVNDLDVTVSNPSEVEQLAL